jgi:hypothetical protein
MNRTQEKGREHLDKAKRVAQAVRDQAKRQADQEGLTDPSKAERVAQAMVDEAKDKADQEGLTNTSQQSTSDTKPAES